jgi:hypothetical protein
LRNSGKPIGRQKSPADFGLQIFAVPWTTKLVYLTRSLIFSQLPFAKGEIEEKNPKLALMPSTGEGKGGG